MTNEQLARGIADEAHLLLCKNKDCGRECNPLVDNKVYRFILSGMQKVSRTQWEKDREAARKIIASIMFSSKSNPYPKHPDDVLKETNPDLPQGGETK